MNLGKKQVTSDNAGNLLVLDLDLEVSLWLINIYGLNIDNATFFKKIADCVEQSLETYYLLCDDLNLGLNPKLDSQNCLKVNNPKARTIVLETMDKNNFTDIFRQLHPAAKCFTWRRRNPTGLCCWYKQFNGYNSVM